MALGNVSEHPGGLAAFVVEATSALGHCARDHGLSIDRPAIEHAVRQAIEVSPSQDISDWWQWLLVAGSGIGVPLRAVDCTPARALEVARHGVNLITLDSQASPASVLLVDGTRGRKPLLIHQGQHQRLPEKALAARCVSDEAGNVRWVMAENVLELHYHDHHQDNRSGGNHGGHGTISPLSRLIRILRPEWSDIWILIVFAVVVGILALATPIAVELLVNTVAFGQFTQPVIILAMLLLVSLSFAAILRALQTVVVEIIQRRLFARVAGSLAWRLPRVEQDAFDSHYGPELVNRFFDVVSLQKSTSLLLLDGVAIVIGTLVGMIVIAFYHPWLLGFDFFLLLLILFMIFILGRGAVRTSIKESVCKYAVADWLEQISRCESVFRLDARSELAVGRADRLVSEWLSAREQHFRIVFRQTVFALGLHAVASTALLALGGWLVVRGQLTLGQLVAAELIVTMILSSFTKLGKHLESFYDLLTAADKLGHLFDLPLEKQLGLLANNRMIASAVQIDGVSYQYHHSGASLAPLTMSIESGEMVGITGPLGSGKSTLCDLLFRLRHPTAGHITVDDVDLRDLQPDALRDKVMLLRDIEVIPGTIAENLHLGRVDWTFNDLRNALRLAGLLEFVSALPDGLSTELNVTGAPLPGSLLVRLMLARALFRQASLLVIDGLLDTSADSEIPDLMEVLRHQPGTVIVVSVRDVILNACDRVHKLKPANGSSGH